MIPAHNCCPNGKVYVDAVGYATDPISGSIITVNYPNDGSQFTKCVILTFDARGYVGNDISDPIDCPCCPTGYTYMPNVGKCYSPTAQCSFCPPAYLDPIPCIVCICIDPEPFVCGTCGTEGERITFAFNGFTKNCTNCTKDNYNPPKGRINCFIPYLMADPNTNGFTLNR